jgi:hypothetical protein
MNNREQQDNRSVKNPFNNPKFTQSDEQAQLKTIGDQIEAIAKRLEARSVKVDCEELYEMGNKIEHFLDDEVASEDWKKKDGRQETPSSSASFNQRSGTERSDSDKKGRLEN